MKKLLLLILSATLAMGVFCAVGCAGGTTGGSTSITSEQPTEKTYIVTFKQKGQSDVKKTVKEGETLTDIPTPATKTGYTVAWEDKDLTNITENITVNAVETANTYKVSYDLNGAEGEISDLEVTYDGAYVLASPTREGYSFIGWTNGEEAVLSSGNWSIASDVTLKANWVEVKVETFTVVFVQAGEALKTYAEIPAGSAFTALYDIPTPVAITGYNVEWDSEELAKLESVTQDVTILAIVTAKSYTVTLNPDGGTLDVKTIEVTYNAEYELPTPTRNGYEFAGWVKGSAAFDNKGTWKIDEENVTLKATWKKVTTEDDNNDDKYWTNNY